MARHRSLIDLDDLAHQISSLRHEVAGVSRSVGRYGSHAAHDVGDQLWHQGEIAAKLLGRQAKKAGKAVREDPVPAVVAVAGFALFLNLVLGRKRS
jgi:hypothetical protein